MLIEVTIAPKDILPGDVIISVFEGAQSMVVERDVLSENPYIRVLEEFHDRFDQETPEVTAIKRTIRRCIKQVRKVAEERGE